MNDFFRAHARFLRLAALASLASIALACSSDEAARTGPTEAEDASIEEMKTEARGDEKVKSFDLNRDKKPDVFKFFTAAGEVERLVRKELDVNWDGNIDIKYFYDDKGTLEREAQDLDFDGRIDTVNFYEKGTKTRSELDLDFDNRIDTWKFFAKGRLVRRERDTNADGKPDYWEYWEGDEIDRIGEDTDGDGQVDKWTKKSAG